MLKCKKRKVKLEKIIITDFFKKSRVSPKKIIRKTMDYFESGHLSAIYINEDY